MLTRDWRKSTRSHTNGCVECQWATATASTGVNCVEVAHNVEEGMVLVRDSKRPGGGVVCFTAGQWALLLDDVAAGHFHWSRFAPLQFTKAERLAFEAGVLAGEFDLPVEAGLVEDRSELRVVPEAERAVWGPTSVTGMGWNQDAVDEANRRAEERRQRGAPR